MTEQIIKENRSQRLEQRLMLLCSGALLLLLAYFSWTTVYSSDDYWYSTFWDHGLSRYLELMDYHYEQFNGRTLVHALAHIVLHFGRGAFVLMCCGLCTAAVWAAGKGSGLDRQKWIPLSCFFLIGILCMPLDIFNQGVTWISAACNYLFPAALSCLMAASLSCGSRWSFLLAFLCGATTEQMGLASAVLAAVYAVYGLVRRKRFLRELGCTIVSLLGTATIFLSPATANRAGTGIRMDSLEMILDTFRQAILREAEILTGNPAPLLVMATVLVMGAAVLWRRKDWKWAAIPAGIGTLMLAVGALGTEGVRVAGFVAAFVSLALMAVLLMAGDCSFAGALTLTGLAAAAVMLPTNTVEPRVMLPVYFLLLVVACVLTAEVIRRPGLPVLAGAVLTVVVCVPAMVGYWHNYQIDLENAAYAREDREKEAVRYCVDYDMTYTWVKADFDPYFRMKYLESIGLPETGNVDFFSWEDMPFRFRCGERVLVRSSLITEDGTVLFPLREMIETLGGSLEWTAERRAIGLGDRVLELEPVENGQFLVRWTDDAGMEREIMVTWILQNGDTYCAADLLTQGLDLQIRLDEDAHCYIVDTR